MLINDDIAYKHLEDIASRQNNNISFTMFLSPAMVAVCKGISNKYNCKHISFGGYDDAQRQLVAFYNGNFDINFPIACLMFKASQNYAIEHSQVMGTILSLGLKRDVLGDIVVNNNIAYAFCLDSIAQHIAQNISKIANKGVDVEVLTEMPIIQKPKGTLKRITVSSLRLDTLIATVFNISRTRSVDIINKSCATVNYVDILKPNFKLVAGDVVSVKGFGKFYIGTNIAQTKKLKNALEIELFTKVKKPS